MVDKETREATPLTTFLRAEQLARDVAQINDAGRGLILSVIGMTIALFRNYDPFKAPTHFKFIDLMKKFDKKLRGRRNRITSSIDFEGDDERLKDVFKRREDRWNFLFIAGMWFQDLFNYDFRRTEMCIIPYGTQEGEISFCAYNTGVGWRKILEKMYMTATLTRWYEEHGRHEIFAGGKNVPLASTMHSLSLNQEAVHASAQTDLDELGIPKNTRQEKLKARSEEMARLYRQHVLKEAPAAPVIQIQGLKKASPKETVTH